jgi:hypothetical protein
MRSWENVMIFIWVDLFYNSPTRSLNAILILSVASCVMECWK